MTKISVLICASLLVLSNAQAERADSFKPTEIKSIDGSTNLVSKVTTLSGDVEIRRGTLLIRADKGVVTVDAQGYQHITLTTGKGGKPVSFRQKRDGDLNQWMEGEALQVEYDEKTELVDLQHMAKARRTTEGVVTDEVSGERISYKSREETYLVALMPGSAAGGDRRGVMVLQPPRKDPLISPVSATASNTGP
jgi:lipopolysaccharide export system protein LptA